MLSPVTALATADWRRNTFALYEQARRAAEGISASHAHALWATGRDRLFGTHPASPLPEDVRRRFRGLSTARYDPAFRFEAVIDGAGAGESMEVATGTDGTVPFTRLGTVNVDGVGSLAVWNLDTYGGGIFVPVRDASSGADGGSYGGGRYLLDTIKGASLGPGSEPGSLVLDFNYLYNPSCAYDEAWACPLPGPANTVDTALPVGELYVKY
ncbi:DUF1684 domain-containing protein [Arthrobacter sp. zg-Y40]|uniref:DUF1684 domain-containing protein n=1 Tax=unclassified Arthrobacter TaxID=235627 RepID=UPI001D13F448|nr:MULTISPECIES: DUF1684 domain-containing protein [unclassified Arthrobacter]MCC3277356.1 DUF1684 domain-containing protein [Arthrobacter sp. zg-Y20]MCC3280043.1 DUF1684 domain-containing protein [Arthrobacter sp. zg-Y40]MDK1317516.1 DUF1684 domain-containing protein [Arthrobacter sp. zg.Y20]MDK1328394.1 DUF1684 domain-containing protein [Arthrobacter sp. zg-Y1143]WIB06985.1 DUF1684 domain-containing protein [Arthrobacter sp. zg-Y20]